MENLVKIENGKAITTSLLVAGKFEKEHRHILDSIRNLVAENSAAKTLFVETQYENRGKLYPMYVMNRDGFSLLVMGFTGNKALNFKLDFINAFNQMEKNLSSDEYILMRSRQILENKISELEYKTEIQEEQLKKQAPKVEYCNRVLQTENTYNTNLIAKELGMSAKSLNKLLAEYNIQYQQNGVWILKSQHQNKGFTKTRTFLFTDSQGNERSQMQTVWTENGRAFIHNVITKKQNNERPDSRMVG